MTEGGFLVFMGILLLLVVIVVVIAVVSSVAGAAAAIVDDEDSEDEFCRSYGYCEMSRDRIIRKETEIIMQLLTFLLNGVKFGIPVNDVESIETRMNVVNIPNSLPQVHGIMNLHGEVIAVYSLAEQFHYPEQEINNIIVASMNGTKIGLEVGNVDEIIDVPDEKVISMPVIMKAVENCFDEVASYAKELIVLIEVSKLMPEAEQQAIQKLVEQQS